MIEAFDIIDAYCAQRKKGLVVRNYAFCILVSSLKAALENSKREKNRDPKPQEIENVRSALLSKEALAGHVAKAEEMILEKEWELRRRIELDSRGPGFWKSVIASVIAAFIYSLLLLVIYLIIKGDMSSLIDLIRSVGTENPVGMISLFGI